MIWIFLEIIKQQISLKAQTTLNTQNTTMTRIGQKIGRKATTCSFCGIQGHNKRTCAAAEISLCLISNEPNEPIIKRKYNCSNCGGNGHNSRGCGLVYDRTLESGTMPGFSWTWWSGGPEEKKIKAGRHCKACGESGHNVRTCPVMQGMLGMCQPCQPCQPTPPPAPRKAKIPQAPNRGVQVTQIVDFNVYDEPWVWAPVRPVNRRLTLGTLDTPKFAGPTFEVESPLVLP